MSADSTRNADAIRARADVIFAERFDQNAERVSRWFVFLFGGQWLFAMLVACTLTPYTWVGRHRTIHEHVVTAFVLGGCLAVGPAILAHRWPRAVSTRHAIAVVQMLWSALLIHLSGGRIETHFHVFGSLAFLAFYRDWRILVPATLVVALDHFLRQFFWPESVFGTLVPESWRFLEHAGWVAFEDLFLVLSCVAGVREMRTAADHLARIEFNEQREREMEIAARIQTAIVPRSPQVEGLEIAARMVPAEDVGGDYYDVLPVNDGCWIGIGDVSGHGLMAGLVMMQTQSAVSAVIAHRGEQSPADVLTAVNHVVFENVRHRLACHEHMTLSLIRYHRDGRIESAGAHQDLLVCRAATGRCERLEPRGTWIGLVPDVRPHLVEVRAQLEPGDLLVLFTDGITELANGNGDEFGIDRLCAVIETAREFEVDVIRDAVFSAADLWSDRRDDDATLLVIRHVGAADAMAA